MKLPRKVAAIVLTGTMLVCGDTRRALAQDATNDAPPDLRMLMNLDLFEPRHTDAISAAAPAAPPAEDSMLDQIRALNQMGYLANRGHADEIGAPASSVAPGAEDVAPAPAQTPASRPSYDVEGPQR